MDRRVEIFGASRQDLNGKRGVAIDYHAIGFVMEQSRSYDKYTVRLDNGEEVMLRPREVRVERVEAAGGKGKGKGKKGRGKRGK